MIVEYISGVVAFIIVASVFLLPISKNEQRNRNIDKETTSKMKGIACLMVIIGHSSVQLEGTGIFRLLADFGFLAVCIFFFVTGYGVMYNLKNKKDYLKGFLKKRLLSILIPFWLSNIIVFIIKIAKGETTGGCIATIEHLLGVELWIGHNWYVQYIFIFYTLFFITARIVKKQSRLLLLWSVISVVVLVLAPINSIEPIPYMLVSVGGLPLGMLLAVKGNVYRSIYKKQILLIAGMLFVITYLYKAIIHYHWMENDILLHISEVLAPIMFVVLLLVFLGNFNVGGVVLSEFAFASYEIFLIHQLVVDSCKPPRMSSSITLLIIITGSFLLGWPLNKIVIIINNSIKSICKRGKC